MAFDSCARAKGKHWRNSLYLSLGEKFRASLRVKCVLVMPQCLAESSSFVAQGQNKNVVRQNFSLNEKKNNSFKYSLN